MADVSQPHHLPNLRPDRQPPDPSWLPRQRRGTTPQMIGRYPDYDVFDAIDTWDAATKKVVDQRMQVGNRELSFFTPDEEATVRAFCDVCVAQDAEPRVPVVEMVDQKMAGGRLDGYQYADMPDDRETWHLVLRGLDEVAQSRYGKASFAACETESRKGIVGMLSKGQLSGGTWDSLNVTRAFAVCMRAILAEFYSHPWAWNEIGFGGPAYPRGYMRLGPLAILEPFEKPGATDEDPVRVTLRGQE
ncbi:MAG: gluconate 2-dehydrogenase subunit 3 family protein [Candidatus Dormibacteria bacterium]